MNITISEGEAYKKGFEKGFFELKDGFDYIKEYPGYGERLAYQLGLDKGKEIRKWSVDDST